MINSILNKINYTQALKQAIFAEIAGKNIAFGANFPKDKIPKLKQEDYNKLLGYAKTVVHSPAEGILVREYVNYYGKYADPTGHYAVYRNSKGNIVLTEENHSILDENGILRGENATKSVYKDNKLSGMLFSRTPLKSSLRKIETDTTLKYGADGKLINVSSEDFKGRKKEVKFKYDKDGNLDSKAITVSSGKQKGQEVFVKFRYDNLGRRFVESVEKIMPKG